MSEPMKVTLDAYQVVEKVVKPGGNSGRVYVPIDWVGKRVKIVLIEALENEE
jgi:putative transposon-encoded protein